MTDAQRYARVLASDADCNGRFFTGVLTTGIYCLPSCKARKPKAENVRFFPTCEAARAAGLRACRKCHPDDFARGADPVLESIETLVTEIRNTPAAFRDVRAVIRRSGFGASRLFELIRRHYHTTPADLLVRARCAFAQGRLLNTNARLTTVAFEAGFESLSVFHQHFRRLTGITPADYRMLPLRPIFEIQLPANYPLNYLRRAWSRDADCLTEHLDNNRYTTTLRLDDDTIVLVTCELSPRAVRVTVSGAPAAGVEIHARLAAMLGLGQDAAAFARLAKKLGLARLVRHREELRIIQTASVYDGLLWAIIGQQINLPFARLLRNRLIALAGTPAGENLHALPTPATVAALTPAALLPLQFSRQKADYLIATSRLIAEGKLDLRALAAMSATRAERTLLAVRGLGPWSVNYVMMRALGFADCVPYGDTGLTSGLQSLLKRDTRPDLDATRSHMAVFAPYRSLATAHLWQLDQPLP
jgi:AraC family transcriptional regulator, regulatory protein of adaptative response / DNA-3-methyladenine glycosylase II